MPDKILYIDSKFQYKFQSFIGYRKIVFLDPGVELRCGMFEGCHELEEVILPENEVEIPDRCFMGCLNLKRIRLPENIARLGSFAFARCESLETIAFPESLIFVGSFAFFHCKSLSSVEGVSDRRKYQANVFYGCNALADSEGYIVVDRSCFGNINDIPSVVIPETAVRIAPGAFRGYAMSSVKIHSQVKEIGSCAFTDCFNLEDEYGFIVVNGIMFGYSGESSDIVIPEGVVEIDMRAINRDFRSIVFPKSLRKIRERAIYPDSFVSKMEFLSPDLGASDKFSIEVESCGEIQSKCMLPEDFIVFLDWESPFRTDNPEFFDDDLAMLAVGFFASNFDSYSSYAVDNHINYIKDHFEEISSRVALDFEFLHFLCAHKVLDKRNCELVMDLAIRNSDVETVAMLMEYRKGLC